MEKLTLHCTAALTFSLLGYVLFRLDAIGGADLKAAIIVGIVSPGFEFGTLGGPVFEGFLLSSVELALMLLIGYLYRTLVDKKSSEPIALIPGLLVAYLLIQTLSLI